MNGVNGRRSLARRTLFLGLISHNKVKMYFSVCLTQSVPSVNLARRFPLVSVAFSLKRHLKRRQNIYWLWTSLRTSASIQGGIHLQLGFFYSFGGESSVTCAHTATLSPLCRRTSWEQQPNTHVLLFFKQEYVVVKEQINECGFTRNHLVSWNHYFHLWLVFLAWKDWYLLVNMWELFQGNRPEKGRNKHIWRKQC